MEFDENLSAIHSYLCADGYVIRNPPSQKQKYYCIGLRNINRVLLNDFQRRFYEFFGVEPIIYRNERCRIGSKSIYYKLTKDFSYYSNEWEVPDLSKENLKVWLRAFFDCEGWVRVRKAKDRSIGLESINGKGLHQIKDLLSLFNIDSSIKKRNGRDTWRLDICGRDDLERFKDQINFLHPSKRKKLSDALESYQTYEWGIPKDRERILKFIKKKGRIQRDRDTLRFFSIKKENLVNFSRALDKYNVINKIYGPWKNQYGTKYYCLTIKQDQIKKLRGE